MVTSPSWACGSEPLIKIGDVQDVRAPLHRTASMLWVARPDAKSTSTSANTTHRTLPAAPLRPTSSHSLSSVCPGTARATTRRVGQHDGADPPGQAARRSGVLRYTPTPLVPSNGSSGLKTRPPPYRLQAWSEATTGSLPDGLVAP